MTVTASAVKNLREETGAGMMECKNALVEADGDMEAARDLLRKRGLKLADKKAGRETQEGLVAVRITNEGAFMAVVNCETDFVARNEKFQDFADLVVHRFSVAGQVSQDEMAQAVSEIGENIQIGDSLAMLDSNVNYATYVHNRVRDNMGTLAVVVAYEGDDAEAARKVAMHIASAKPKAVSVDELDPDWVAKEKEFLMDQARESGKPEEIIEKMVVGRMTKSLKEVSLVDQPFVVDPDRTVGKFLDEHGINVVTFARYAITE